MRFNLAGWTGAVLVALSVAGALALTLPAEEPSPFWEGHIAQDLAHPSATPWASLLTDNEVRNPPGALLKVATWTPTPTATATPTATPEPTWTPAPVYPTWTPEPAYVAPPQPAQPAGSIQSLICSFGWDCLTALRIAECESGFNPGAYNGHHVGIFQLDPYYHTWRSPTGEIWSAYGNVAAAYHRYLEQGWAPWSCR